ncbi:hypothetical protein BgiMline_019075, partial [Biomphalaria glabrata]
CCTRCCQTKASEKYENVILEFLLDAQRLPLTYKSYILKDARYIKLKKRLTKFVPQLKRWLKN